jgi:hypothetical protein
MKPKQKDIDMTIISEVIVISEQQVFGTAAKLNALVRHPRDARSEAVTSLDAKVMNEREFCEAGTMAVS